MLCRISSIRTLLVKKGSVEIQIEENRFLFSEIQFYVFDFFVSTKKLIPEFENQANIYDYFAVELKLEAQKVECLIGDLFEGNNFSKVPVLLEIKAREVKFTKLKSSLLLDYFSSSFLRIYSKFYDNEEKSPELLKEISKHAIESFIITILKKEKRKPRCHH